MDLTDTIIIKQGDITDFEVDAVVNAANTDLILGSGVAGAIRRKGGDSIQTECSTVGSIPLGQAAITAAGKLKAEFVIHAAGMHLGGKVTAMSLNETTINCLKRANEKELSSMAFPAIGTGVGGFPLENCAQIMIDAIWGYLRDERTSIEKVYFVLFDERSFKVFDEYCKKKVNP